MGEEKKPETTMRQVKIKSDTTRPRLGENADTTKDVILNVSCSNVIVPADSGDIFSKPRSQDDAVAADCRIN